MKKGSYIKLLLLSTSILAFNTITIDSAEAAQSDISGTLEMKENSTLNLSQSTKITTTGKVINKTINSKLYNASTLEIEAGSTTSATPDESTGTFHNHGTLTIYKGTNVHGTGQIINYNGFIPDKINTDLAGKDKDAPGYKKSDYKAENDLSTTEELEKATYYELVNGSRKVTSFEIYTGGKVIGTNVDTPDGTPLTDSNSRIINNEGKGDKGDSYGYIAKTVTIASADNPLKQTSTKQIEAYNLGSASKHVGKYTTEHNSDAKDEVAASFYTLEGFTPYATKVTNGTGNESKDISSTDLAKVPSGASTFKFNLKNAGTKESPQYSYTPVFIPAVDDKVVIVKTTPDSPLVQKYEKDLMNALDPTTGAGAFEFSDWTSSDPVTTYSGDNSWFNGVFKLNRGAVIVPNTAGMLGGRVEIGKVDSSYTTAKVFHEALNSSNPTTKAEALKFAQICNPTEFEWQGGAKDEYNRPDIYMNGNASLYFNLQPDENGNQIFSLYGNITGSEYDRLIFQNGTIYIKGDCSGYKGRIAVAQGGKFEVRSSDAGSTSTYKGKFPNADIYQIDSNGKTVTTPGQQTEVDTAGMENVTVNNGHILLKNGEGKVTLENSKIAQGAMMTIDGESEINDVSISGLAVAKGDMKAKNITISGGVFAVEGSVTTENMEAGSTLALWGNNKIDRNVSIGSAAGGTFTITDKHTLKLYNDFDLSSGKADQINTLDTVVVHSGNGVQIGGMNFINNPNKDEYKFTILTGAAAPLTPITIGAVYNGVKATFVAYQHASFTAKSTITEALPRVPDAGAMDNDLVYDYNPTGTKLPTTLNNGVGQVTINGINYYIYGSSVAGAGNILMTRLVGGHTGAVESMHLTGLGSVSSLYGLISDDYGYKDKKEAGKYSFWSKSFAESDKYNTSSSDIKSKNWGTIFGFDGKPMALSKFNSEFMPTIFGGISHRNMKFSSYKAKQDGYIFGGKGAFFNQKSCLELFASYELLKTHSRIGTDKISIKSHVFSVGSKLGYNFQVSKNLTLRPNLLADYSFVKTPNYSGGSIIKSVSTKSMHKFDLAPGININGEFGHWGSLVFVTYHRNFGTKAKATMNNMAISNIDVTKPHYVEYGIGVNRRSENDTGNISLKLSRKTNGIKGFKLTFNCGIKF